MTDIHEQREQTRTKKEPTRHAKIMRGVVTPIFGLLAVACIVFGILNQTIWQPNPQIAATAPVRNTQYLLVDQGVANLVDKNVRIEAASPSATANDGVCMALTSPKDAAGWLAGQPYERITGLSNWSTLSYAEQGAQGEANTSGADVAFKDSNMWKEVNCGAGKASLDLKDAAGTDVVLADFGQKVSDGSLEMHWTRHDIPNFSIPWYFAGGLCAVLAVLCASVFAMDMSARRKKVSEDAERARQERQEQRKDEPKIGEALAGSLAALKPRSKGKSKTKGGPRHGRHAGKQEDEQPTTPTIVDPHARNLVAEQAQQANENASVEVSVANGSDEASETATRTVSNDGSATDGTTTSVITEAELQDYFARLAREVGMESSTPSEQGEPEAERVQDTDESESSSLQNPMNPLNPRNPKTSPRRARAGKPLRKKPKGSSPRPPSRATRRANEHA